MIPVKRILVPTDFSETSDAALKYGIGLAQAFSAQLYLLHVPKTGVNFEADFPMVQFETAPQERLETLVGEQEARQLRPEYALRIGAPSDEIVRYAGYREIDLIVMGTHGRSGMPHMLMGSVAEKVLRTAPCPVLTVRPPRGAPSGRRRTRRPRRRRPSGRKPWPLVDLARCTGSAASVAPMSRALTATSAASRGFTSTMRSGRFDTSSSMPARG